jgi:propanol-preferring alcohol dehydrogenase
VGSLVPSALASVRKGGTVVLGGIHMSDLPSMPYALFWGERVVRSVANLKREDAREFLALAGRTPIQTHVVPFALGDANTALDQLRSGALTGAAVLVPNAAGR